MSQDDVFFTQNQSFKCRLRKGGEVSLPGLIVTDSLVTELFLASLAGRQCSI